MQKITIAMGRDNYETTFLKFSCGGEIIPFSDEQLDVEVEKWVEEYREGELDI